MPKVIFLGPNKTEIMFIIVLASNIVKLIFLGSLEVANAHLFLHCFRIFYLHIQVSKSKMS